MTEENTKLIECPEHKVETHKATLYCYPHKYAGIWECNDNNEGISDTHEHDDYEVEETVEDHLGFQGHYQTESSVYVCGGEDGCGVVIEGADPAEDRYEASLNL